MSSDSITEIIVMTFLDLMADRRIAGKQGLAATQETIAEWLSTRTSLSISAKNVQDLVKVLQDAGLITIGGGGIGLPNSYYSNEDSMGAEQFWTQVDALLLVWKHPSRNSITKKKDF